MPPKSGRHLTQPATYTPCPLCRMLDGRATHVETGSYGTPTHAAPELLQEGRLSPAVDLYAFGILGESAAHSRHWLPAAPTG
jgi:serine/threonine protein kinase